MDNLEYKLLCKEESHGSYGSFGIQILVAGSNLPDLDASEIWNASTKARETIKSEIMALSMASLPDTVKASERNRELLNIFDEPIFVEEIPNGYCSRWCCRHLPWFIVTTKVGRIRIGWRKRVICIEWEDTIGTKTSEELFAEEDTTKGERMIHAWSIENAKRYIDKILGIQKITNKEVVSERD